MSTAGELGERQLIDRIAAVLRDDAGEVLGDDCAVVTAGAGMDFVLTSDTVIAGTHFDAAATPDQIGHKAAGRVFSDIASMGATPLWLLTDLVAPASMPVRDIEDIYRAARGLCERFDARIVGGDTAAAETFQLHVFGVGTLPTGTALMRSAARVGDAIYVTGRLGGSQSGHHLRFIPRIREGTWLREHGFARAAIDLSDGLACDLHHLLEMSHVGAELDLTALPLSADCAHYEAALEDGEDYELLFTCLPEQEQRLQASWPFTDVPLTRIGDISAGHAFTGRQADGHKMSMTARGYEHFTDN